MCVAGFLVLAEVAQTGLVQMHDGAVTVHLWHEVALVLGVVQALETPCRWQPTGSCSCCMAAHRRSATGRPLAAAGAAHLIPHQPAYPLA
ncbi:hypothetical protein OG426_01345 [Streptomyces canus]|uniref:hypothetical protein n=1 Tax=Streptomyces canus TaxID=58343 RepID=UPI0038647BF7|nr:hypothetical protein OG426_01345 [Streptomyces canus]